MGLLDTNNYLTRQMKLFILFFSYLLVITVVYFTGGTKFSYSHLIYIPILFSSFFFRLAGGILGGLISGITPLWASEIEPFPIRVTTKRMPWVKHLGDISTINGADIEPVDIITFGSPCTDMSVAGKRAGLDGKQSGTRQIC